MNYNEFVDRPQKLKGRIEHQIDDVNFRWSLCQNITPSLHERVQTSPSNTTERSYLNYIEAKKKLDRLYEEYDIAVETLRDFFYSNLEYEFADMLDWRYVSGKDIKQIAEIKGMTYESAKNKIAKANRESERCYNDY